MTAPIFFNVKEAREQLEKHGTVYTIRHKRSTGLTTARSGGFYKFNWERKVKITQILQLNKEAIAVQLCEYVSNSGFSTVQEWLSNVRKWEYPMYLYKVEEVTR